MDPDSRLPGCLCATRAYEADPLPDAPLATRGFPPLVAPRPDYVFYGPKVSSTSWADAQIEPGSTG